MSAGDRIVLAAVARPHGLRGAVRMKVFNPESQAIRAGARLWLTSRGGEPRRVEVREAIREKETWIVSLRGVDSHEAADALRGAELSIERESLPPPEEGEYYHADLVGCSVRDASGTALGEVADVITYPSVDALLVKRSDGTETEIPWVDGIVTCVDLAARIVTVDADSLGGE